jgi:hypothetical protein
MGAGFIADPVALRIPERSRLESDNIETDACKTLQKNTAGGPNPNDDVIHLFKLVKPAHRQANMLESPKHMLFAAARRLEGSEEWLIHGSL